MPSKPITAEAILAHQSELIAELKKLVAPTITASNKGQQHQAAAAPLSTASLVGTTTSPRQQQQQQPQLPPLEEIVPEISPFVTEELLAVTKSAQRADTRRWRDVPVDDLEANATHVDWPSDPKDPALKIRPWFSNMAPPSNWDWEASKVRDVAPKVKLELEHIHGYRSVGTWNNLAAIGEDMLVFPVATLVVVLNTTTGHQRFFKKHKEDVLALDFHDDTRLVATGDQGKLPALYVWKVDDPTGEPLMVFQKHHRGVAACAFSPSGARLASIGIDNDHTVIVYDLATKSRVITFPSGPARIACFGWLTPNGFEDHLATAGEKHLSVWSWPEQQRTSPTHELGGGGGSPLPPRSGSPVGATQGVQEYPVLIGRMGAPVSQQVFPSLAVTNAGLGEFVVGSQTGVIYVIRPETNSADGEPTWVAADYIDGHHGTILCLRKDTHTNSTRVLSGGEDGYVSRWDMSSRRRLGSVNLNSHADQRSLAGRSNAVTALAIDTVTGIVIAGTVASMLYAITLHAPAPQVSTLQRGHSEDFSIAHRSGELRGLAARPGHDMFVTAGDDRTIRLWDIAGRRQVSSTFTLHRPTSVAFHPNGNILAVGLEGGAFAIYSVPELVEVHRMKKIFKRVTCLQYSTDGTILAVGTATNNVYVYTVGEGTDDPYRIASILKGNISVVLTLDLTVDGKHLRTTSQAYELMHFQLEGAKVITDLQVIRDLQWATVNTTLGWNVQGIWPKDSDGNDVFAVSLSKSGKLLATAEASGLVRVFNYPCVGSGLDPYNQGQLARRPRSVSGLAHSENVTNVTFCGARDEYVISIGGTDQAVCIWKVDPTA